MRPSIGVRQLSAAILLLAGFVPGLAAAQINETFDLVAYRGRLEKNGQGLSAPVTLRFTLYNRAADPSTALYQETIPGVALFGGEFGVTLGANGVIPGTVMSLRLGHVLNQTPEVYVGIVVTDAGVDVPLNGRQRLLSAPFASGVMGVSRVAAGTTVTANTVSATTVNATGTIVAAGNVSGANLVTGGRLELNGSANPWALSADNADKVNITYFNSQRISFQGNGGTTIRALGGIQGNSTPDIAETIPAAPDVETADVVCADPNQRERAVRCAAGGRGLLGVISDGTSTFMINSHGGPVDAPLSGKPLVLAGRVPVKVSLENGPIRIGDQLAPSSVAGVAMRATEPGPVVGVALDAFDGTSGKTSRVLCFVKVGEGNTAAVMHRMAQDLRARDAQLAALEKRLAAMEARVAGAKKPAGRSLAAAE